MPTKYGYRLLALFVTITLACALPGLPSLSDGIELPEGLPDNATAIFETAQALGEQVDPASTEAVSIAQTAAAAVENIETVEPASAEESITVYARDVFGIEVEPIYAGGLSGDVTRELNASEEAEAASEAVANVALISYGALFSNGAATLSYGDGAITGDLDVDINTASLGVFSFLTSPGIPLDEAEARAKVLEVFPGLADREFVGIPTVQGYTWNATSQVPGYDSETQEATMVTEVVQIGLTSGGPRGLLVFAYAIVGRGSFAGAIADE